MNQPLISVIVPVYNIKEYLPRCIDSICHQTYKHLEIIVIDDGSNDGTSELCDELAKLDARIIVMHKENGGSSSARNLGIQIAKGELLGFVDSDDYLEYNMYELMVEAIMKFQGTVVQIGRNEIAMDGSELPIICEPPTQIEEIPVEVFLRDLLLHVGDCSFCTKLIRKEVFKDHLFPIGVLNEDFHLFIELLPHLHTVISLPQIGYHVFCREGSNTRKRTGVSRVFSDNVDNADMVSAIVEKEYPSLKEVAFRFGIFQRIDYLLHIPIPEMKNDNVQYQEIVSYLRKNWWKGMRNAILTPKNKIYQTLFAIAPKGCRILHKRVKGL